MSRSRTNPRWFRGLLNIVCEDPVCERAVAHGVLGHEMTHHVNGDALVPEWIRNRHDQELRADFFAGRALAVFGDDVAALEAVLAIIGTYRPTPRNNGLSRQSLGSPRVGVPHCAVA
jgi:hypothetical protein